MEPPAVPGRCASRAVLSDRGAGAPSPVLSGGGAPSPVLARLGSGSAAGWDRLDRILAVRLDSLGDVVMSTPALRALKAQHPRRHLALLTSPSGAEVAALIPEVDETIVYEAPWMKGRPGRAPAPGRAAAADLAMVRHLSERQFDGAVIFTVNSQNPLPAAFLCQLAGIPRRVGHCRENPYALLTEWVVEPEPVEPIRHEARRQLDLVAAVGARPDEEHLSVRVPAEAARQVRARLQQLGLDPACPWLLVHPGATAASRHYPPSFLGEAIRGVVGRTGWPVVIAGGPDDLGRADEVRRAARVPMRSLAGELSVGELAALVAMAPLLIANNSGPMHLAAATGTPVVCLYALTNLQHAPWMVPARVLSHDVPCRGCLRSVCPEGHHLCLRGVTPEVVVEACLDLAAEVGLMTGLGS